MDFRLQIPQALYEEMIAHARAELPNECVGLLAGRPGGMVVERYPLINALADPRRFESDARSMFDAEKRRRVRELEFLAVYHSHPTSAPVPSETDLEFNYSEDVMSVIISLQTPEPVVQAYWLTTRAYRAAGFEVIPEATAP